MVIKIILGVMLYLSIGFGTAIIFNVLNLDPLDFDLDNGGSTCIVFLWPLFLLTIFIFYPIAFIAVTDGEILKQISSALDGLFRRIRNRAEEDRKAAEKQQAAVREEEQRQKDLAAVGDLLKSVEQGLLDLHRLGRVPERIYLGSRAYELLKAAMDGLYPPIAVETTTTLYGLPVEMWLGMDGISFYISSYDPEEVAV